MQSAIPSQLGLTDRSGSLQESFAGKTLLVIGATAFVAACAHISFPLPFTPVPLTLQNFAVILVGMALGPVAGFSAMVLYLAEGALGPSRIHTKRRSRWPGSSARPQCRLPLLLSPCRRDSRVGCASPAAPHLTLQKRPDRCDCGNAPNLRPWRRLARSFPSSRRRRNMVASPSLPSSPVRSSKSPPLPESSVPCSAGDGPDRQR